MKVATKSDTRIEGLRAKTQQKVYKQYRQTPTPDVLAECEAEKLSWTQRMARLTVRMCQAQRVVINPDEKIVFTRTTPAIPPIYSPQEWDKITQGGNVHELGPISNICADWGMVLSDGLLRRKQVALQSREQLSDDPSAIEFLDCAIETIDAVLELTQRYAQAAREIGRDDIADMLDHAPAHRPRTFKEALQALRLCHSFVWLSSHYHVGLGRFDQYMWPYLEGDLDAGRLDIEQAEDLLAEFFILLNRDSDLYPGVQQGDNGQSLMLGGVTRDGTDAVNELTQMCLRVAARVSMIDPKINLRISSQTDLELLELATQLTCKGLGFPQYSNDDVVIPALVAHGYELPDARDYSVAACWEFIIPGKGMEIVNIDAVSMPQMTDRAIREGLQEGDDFDGILERTRRHIRQRVNDIIDAKRNIILPPAPYYSVLMNDCLETGKDLSQGLKYNNFGIHGACVANAADALAAVKKYVFDEKTVSPDRLLNALNDNFLDDEPLRKILAENAPKVGNNDDFVDDLLVHLLNDFADACETINDNGRGGIVRPGAGSAMYYVWAARKEGAVGATADGRKTGDFFSANLAPSLGAPVRGPVSVMQSFAKIDYHRICNGGPLTLELSDTVFTDDDSLRKVAMLVSSYIRMGGQQLQLNTLNPDMLKKAKKHPENYRNLIVRVWGWSGYFCELSEEYQDHIIARHAYKT